MSPAIYLTTLSMVLGTVLIVFGLKYVSAAIVGRARLANDGAYKTIAEKAAAAQAETQATLGALQADLAKLSASLAAVEKILKQVE